ncbi:MAG: ABC transporter ATP-binding protein [Acidimicrobiia bacterium]
MATPLIERAVIDDVITTPTKALWPLLVLLVGLGVVNFGLAYVRRFVGGRFGIDVQHDLRTTIFEHLQRLDFARHDELPTGQLVSRASSDLALVQGLLAFLPLATGNLLLFVLSLAVMLVLSPLLTLIVALTVPALVVVSLALRRSMYPAQWDALQHAGEVAQVVDEAVTGVRVVKGFGQEDRELGRLADTATGLYRSNVRAVRIQARYSAMLQAIPAFGQVGVLALGGWLAIEGHISVGTFLAFATYLAQLLAPARMFAGMLAMAEQARAGAERIFDLLDSTPVVTESPTAAPLALRGGEVVLRDVTFGYLSHEPVLRGFDLHVAPGETVALVGASGSGKSTVGMLLPRFYDVQGGAVEIDGVDVRDVTLDSLRRSVGVVFEDAFLFSDTVRANIAYGRPEATDDEVVRAARAAGAHDFVAALPDGYDTRVGERGLTLSGGQRQRLAIARAILTDPEILVLDDATSSVDARTEEQIHATLRELMETRTTVLVAHRRSTLRLADRVAVVEHGRAVEEGTHDELFAPSTRYRAARRARRLRGGGRRRRGGVGGGHRRPLGSRHHGRLRGVPPRLQVAQAWARPRWGGAGPPGARAHAHARAHGAGRRAAPGRRRPRGRRRRRGRRRPRRVVPAAPLPPPVPPGAGDRLRPRRRRHAAHHRRAVPRALRPRPGRAGTGDERCGWRPSSTSAPRCSTGSSPGPTPASTGAPRSGFCSRCASASSPTCNGSVSTTTTGRWRDA